MWMSCLFVCFFKPKTVRDTSKQSRLRRNRNAKSPAHVRAQRFLVAWLQSVDICTQHELTHRNWEIYGEWRLGTIRRKWWAFQQAPIGCHFCCVVWTPGKLIMQTHTNLETSVVSVRIFFRVALFSVFALSVFSYMTCGKCAWPVSLTKAIQPMGFQPHPNKWNLRRNEGTTLSSLSATCSETVEVESKKRFNLWSWM